MLDPVAAERHEGGGAAVDHEVRILRDHPLDERVHDVDVDAIALQQVHVGRVQRRDGA
jgi:hypothetical protein